MLNLDYGYKTDKGMVREVNEDRYLYVNEEDYVLLAVADGMGGHNAGDIASQMAIDEVLKYNLNQGFFEDTVENIKKCIENANSKIYKHSTGNPGCHGMGTTLTMAIIIGNTVYFANVGDSRGYIIGKDIKKITVDHSYVEELIRIGKITEAEAMVHPNKNQITRAIGTAESVEPDIFVVGKNDDDIILLCTDGLSTMLSSEEITNEINKSANLQMAVDIMVAKANEKGGSDNITVVSYTDRKGE